MQQEEDDAVVTRRGSTIKHEAVLRTEHKAARQQKTRGFFAGRKRFIVSTQVHQNVRQCIKDREKEGYSTEENRTKRKYLRRTGSPKRGLVCVSLQPLTVPQFSHFENSHWEKEV